MTMWPVILFDFSMLFLGIGFMLHLLQNCQVLEKEILPSPPLIPHLPGHLKTL